VIKLITQTKVGKENGKAVVEVVFASVDYALVSEKLSQLKEKFPEHLFDIHSLKLDTDLSQLSDYPSVSVEL